MQLTRTVAPTYRPVTDGQVLEHLRVTDDAEQQLASSMLDAVLAYLDGPRGILGRCIITQTWRLELAEFANDMTLPVEPVQSVTVQYRNDAGAWVTLTGGTDYDLLTPMGEPPRVALGWNAAWPTTGDYRYPVRIDMVAGEAIASADVQALVLMLTAHWFQNREAVSDVQMMPVPMSVSALIDNIRRGWKP